MPVDDRRYLVGETPTLRIQTKNPSTGRPEDVTAVTLDSFTLRGVQIALATTTFTREAEGAYELVIPTANLDPGVYHLRIKIQGPLGTTYKPDTIVLADPVTGDVPGTGGSGGGGGEGSVTEHERLKKHYKHRGLWVPGTTYLADEIVTAMGALWVCHTRHDSVGFHIDESKFTIMTGFTPWTVGSLKFAGHSYIDVGPLGEDDFGRGYFPGRLMTALGLGPNQVQNFAVSGSTARWHYYFTLQGINPGERKPPLQADVGVGVIWYGGNDAILNATEDTWGEYTFKCGYHSIISRMRAGAVYENDSVTVEYEGTWTTLNYEDFFNHALGSGTSATFSSVVGDKIKITTPKWVGVRQEGVWIQLGFLGADSGAAAKVSLDGELHGYLDTGQGPEVGTYFGTQPDTPTGYVYRMWVPTIHTDENHYYTQPRTIEIEITGGVHGAGLAFDYWAVEADDPPVVLALSTVSPSNARWIWATLSLPSTVAIYNKWTQEVIESFDDPTVRYVDVNYVIGGYASEWSKFSNQRYFNGDGLHPNTIGGQLIAEACVAEINAAVHSGVHPRHLLGRSQFERDPMWETPVWLVSDKGNPLATVDTFNRSYNDEDLGASTVLEVGRFGTDGKGQAMLVDSGWTNLFQWSDNFERADGAPGNVASSRDGVTVPWVIEAGTAEIVGEHLEVTGLSLAGDAIVVMDTGSVDQWIEAEIHSTGANPILHTAMILVRYVDPSNYIVLAYNIFGVGILYTCINDAFVAVASGFVSATRPHIEVDAATHTVNCYDPTAQEPGITWPIPNDVDHAQFLTATKVGFRGTSVGTWWDSFLAGNTVVDPATLVWDSDIALWEVGDADGVTAIVVGDDGSGFPEFVGFVWRVVDSDNYMRAIYESQVFGAWVIQKVVGGVVTESWVYWVSVAIGDQIAVANEGNEVRFYRNGVLYPDLFNHLTVNIEQTTTLTGTQAGLFAARTAVEPFARWGEFLWGKFMPSSKPTRGSIFIDRSDPSRVEMWGPFDRRSGGGGWGDTPIDVTPAIHGFSVINVAVDHVVEPTDEVIFMTTTGGQRQVTLPDPADLEGRAVVVRKVSSDGNNLVVVSAVGQVDGGVNKTWATTSGYRFVSDGVASWWSI